MTATEQSANIQNRAQPQFRGRLARTMIIALFLFTLVPLLIMGATAYFRASNLLRNQMSNQLEGIVNSSAGDLEEIFKAKLIRLKSMLTRPEFADPVSEVLRSNGTITPELKEKVLQAFSDYNRPEGSAYFSDFIIVDVNGDILLSTQSKWEDKNIANSEYFKEFSEDPHSFGTFDFIPGENEVFATLTMVPFTESANQVGYLVGITSETSVKNYLSQMSSFNESSKPYYVLEDRDFIHIDPHTLLLVPFSPSDNQLSIIEAALPVEENTRMIMKAETLSYKNDAGINVIAESRWMPFIETAIVIEVPENVILSQLNSLTTFTVVLLLTTLIAMGIALYVSINRLIKPILSLTQSTRQFAEGNWNERAEIDRNDEVGLLAHSFNLMADDLSDLYRTLENRVEEHARQINTAAEVAQEIIPIRNLNELLQRATSLISERFGYEFAGIYLLDRPGRYAILRAVEGSGEGEMLKRGHKLAVGSPSLIGWVTANNQPRVVTTEAQYPSQYQSELLPDSRSQVAIPISLGTQVLGALTMQSTDIGAFGHEAVVTLQTLATQIASVIQNTNMADSIQVDLTELDILYRASLQIGRAQTRDEVVEQINSALNQLTLITAAYLNQSGSLDLVQVNNPDDIGFEPPSGMSKFPLSPDEVASALSTGPIVVELGRKSTAPDALIRLPRQLGCKVAAFIPLTTGNMLDGLLILGSTNAKQLTPVTIQPYLSLADTIAASLEKAAVEEGVQRRIKELEAISRATQSISVVNTLDNLYVVLHDEIRQFLGDYNFLIALYDRTSDTIKVPYMYESGQINSLDAFPLGEGLTSIMIRTGQPLMLVENTEKRSIALGAKVVGRPAKSWLGAPLLIGEEPVGAIIVQDLDREFAFSDNDLHFVTALATQAAGAINNVRLLEDSRRRSLQLETAAEIAKDISSALDLDELLSRAISLISVRFNFYHASVFMVDATNENVIIREATGEAGAQMKRAGHKLGIGSKSIVGYVAGQGEPLVVSDTSRDATYYANPLLPDTRAEAAIPLKVGERIVGVLDVQSTQPHAFTEEALRTMQILSDQLAVAVVNSELFAETQEHLSQHRLLHHITTSAASGSTLDEALSSAVQGLQVTLGGDRVAIMLLNKEKEALEITASIGYSDEDTANLSIPIGSGVTGWVAAHRVAQRVDNVHEDSRYIEVSSNTKSEMAIPLLFRNEVLGVLNIESEAASAYDEHDEELLGTLGGSLAAIIANAKLLEQIRRQVDRERLLYEVTSKIRRSTDMQTILQTTANELNKAVGARRTQIKIAPSINEDSKKE